MEPTEVLPSAKGHCKALGLCWWQWLPSCQRRWEVQVMSDRLPGCMGCSWRELFPAISELLGEESVRGLGVEGDLGFQEETHHGSLGAPHLMFLFFSCGYPQSLRHKVHTSQHAAASSLRSHSAALRASSGK